MAKLSVLRSILNETSWRYILAKGIVAVILGLLFLFKPGEALFVLMILLGAWFCANGIILFINASKLTKGKNMVFLFGAISIIAGIVVFMQPLLAEVVFIVLIAVWALFTGFGQLALAVNLRQAQPLARGVIALGGMISVIVGILLLTRPGAGLQAIAWIVGIYLLLAGIFAILLGVFVKKKGKIF